MGCPGPFQAPEHGLLHPRGQAEIRGESAARQRRGAAFTCADAVAAAAAAAAAAATAFAATVSAAAVPALPPGSSIVSAAPGPEARQSRGSRNGRRPTELRHWGAGGTGNGGGQRGNPGEPGPERGAAGGRGGELYCLRSWGSPFPARLSPPASPSGVGAPAGAPGDEPGLEVAGEYAPGTRAEVARGKRIVYLYGARTQRPGSGAPRATPASRTDSALALGGHPRATVYHSGLPGPMAGGEPC